MSHKITVKQHRAIALMARGVSGVEIARQIGLRRETISRWKQRPEFQQELERVLDDMREAFRHRLVQLVDHSIGAIEGGLGDYCAPARVEVGLKVLRMLGIERILLPKVCEDAPNSNENAPT